MKRFFNSFSELVRRKVVRLLGAYVVILWLLAQGFADVFPAFGLPDWSLRVFIIVGLAVIPLIAWLSWKYDLAPPHIVRDVEDVESVNPSLSWAMHRHDDLDAEYVLLKWTVADDSTKEKRFFKVLSIGRGLDNEANFGDERVSGHLGKNRRLACQRPGEREQDVPRPLTRQGYCDTATSLRIEIPPQRSDVERLHPQTG